MFKISIRFFFIIASLAFFSGIPSTAQAVASSPLLMAGKKTLYQQVIARPNAVLRSAPNNSSKSKSIVPFTVYFVYERRQVDGKKWVRVGADRHGNMIGWILGKQVVNWKQTLTVAFKDPLAQNRIMFFRDRASLQGMIENYGKSRRSYLRYYREAEQGKISSDSPVIAIQPKVYVDINTDFYLVPILEQEEIFLQGVKSLMLKVASVPMPWKEDAKSEKHNSQAGIVFVMDTTSSMGPYIEKSREVIKRLLKSIQQSDMQGKVNFGLIGFRDNLEKASKLGYVSKVFVPLEDGGDETRFFSKVQSVKPARTSSYGFIEDAFAGINSAIGEIKWAGLKNRFVILITDAGARSEGDPLGATGMSAKQIHQLAVDKGIHLIVLHLLTPQGKNNHESAQAQYKSLTHFPGIMEKKSDDHMYFPVRMGDVDAFGRVSSVFVAFVKGLVHDMVNKAIPAPVPDLGSTKSELGKFKYKLNRLGYALLVRYLERLKGSKAPDVFNAWVLDHDFLDPESEALEVRVLMTRDQLSDLYTVLKEIKEAVAQGLESGKSFLDDLKSIAATISRDPNAVSARTASGGGKTLAQLGFMREYLEDLPYTGDVLNLSLEEWESWPYKKQNNFFKKLDSKIRYYKQLHDDVERWISWSGGKVTGDSVFPIKLDQLP